MSAEDPRSFSTSYIYKHSPKLEIWGCNSTSIAKQIFQDLKMRAFEIYTQNTPSLTSASADESTDDDQRVR